MGTIRAFPLSGEFIAQGSGNLLAAGLKRCDRYLGRQKVEDYKHHLRRTSYTIHVRDRSAALIARRSGATVRCSAMLPSAKSRALLPIDLSRLRPAATSNSGASIFCIGRRQIFGNTPSDRDFLAPRRM